MPLTKQPPLTIPLGLGLETDVDEKLLPVGKVVALENALWSRDGEVLKRPGSTLIGNQYAANTPGTMPAAWQLATHKGAAVSLSKAGPRPLGVYSPSVNRWVAPAGSSALDNINGVVSKLRGQILPRRTTVYRGNSVGETSRFVFNPDVATNGTYAAVAWLEATSSTELIRMYVVEIATGKKLFEYSQSMTFGQANVRVVYVNGEFDLIYRNGSNLRGRSWSIANITAGGSGWQGSGEFTLATDIASQPLDVIAKGNDVYAIYSSAGSVRVCKATGGVSGGVFTLNNLTTSVGGAIGPGQAAWMRDLSGSGALSAVVGTSALGVTVQWNITGGTPTASYTMDAAVGQPVFVEGHTIGSSGTGEFVVTWELFPAPTQSIRWGRRFGGVVSSPGTWILSAGLASQAWLHNGEFYILTRYDSATQGTYFASRVPTNLPDATDNTRTPSARFCTGSGVTLNTTMFSLPTVTALSTDVFLSAANVKVRIVASPAGNQYDAGVDTVTLTYNPSNVNGPREFADSLYVCGGVLGAFDGVTFAEEGFHLFPEITGVTQQVAGGLETGGNYIWTAVYRYTDNFGRVRRSAPSEPTALIAMTGANKGALVAVKTLKFHGRPCRVNDGGRAGSVVIELYRTSNNEDAENLLTAVVDNDESVDTITITDTATDVTLGQPLYTDGGVLESQPPPPALAVMPYKDRLAVISAEDPTLVWVSFPLSPTEGPRFNEESTFRIDDGRGDLTGLAAVDDRLIAFKGDAIYTVNGDGPDVNGNGSFGIPQIVASGVGCSVPRSIAQVPDGVMFQSNSNRTGMYLVNRGLALEYVGKDVQSFLQDGGTVVDTVHIPEQQRTRVFVAGGRTLIYDHAIKRWSTDTGTSPAAACAYLGGYLFEIGGVSMIQIKEDTGGTIFSDSSSPVEEYVETPWVALNQLKGYERFYKVQLVGAGRIISDVGDSGYRLELTIWKDYNQDTPLTQQTKDMLVTDDINKVELKYSAKLTAIKVGVRIRLNPSADSNFAGPKLTALAIEWGGKQGMAKSAYNRTT